MIKNNWILFTQKRKINGKAGYERVSKFQREISQFSPLTGLALEPVVPIEWLMQYPFARRCRWLAGLSDCWRSTRPSTSNRGTCFACAGCDAMCSVVWGSDSRWMVSWGRHVPCKVTENLFNDFAYQLSMNLHEDGNDRERHEENLRECNQSQDVALLKFYQGDQKTSAPPTVLT